MREQEVKVFILKALSQAGNEPMPDSTLRAAIRLAFPHGKLSETEIGALLMNAESEGWIAGITDQLLGRVWSLTMAGKARVAQL